MGWLSNLPVRKYHLPWWVCPGNPFHKLIVSPLRKYIVKCNCFLEPQSTKSYFQNFSLEVVCQSGRVDLSMRDYVKQEKTDLECELGSSCQTTVGRSLRVSSHTRAGPLWPSQPPCFSLSLLKVESSTNLDGGTFILLSFILNRWSTCWCLSIMKRKKPNWSCLERNFLKLCKKKGKGRTQSKLMDGGLVFEFLKLLGPLEWHLSSTYRRRDPSSLGLRLWFPVAWVQILLPLLNSWAPWMRGLAPLCLSFLFCKSGVPLRMLTL